MSGHSVRYQRIPLVIASHGRAIALAAAAALAATSTLAFTLARNGLAEAQIARTALQARLTSAQNATTVTSQSATFVDSLPARTQPQPFIAELAKALSGRQVQLGSLDTSSQLATSRTLGQLSTTVAMRGAYAPIKLVLNEALAASPATRLASLEFKRASNGELETRTVFVSLSQPMLVPVAAAAGTR